MLFRQYQLGCLSLFSYLIGDETTGRAVVVDPQRDIAQYLGDAKARGLRIERVIETHFHADFLSGHLEIAAATGAVISYGEAAKTEFAMEPLADGQRLSLGEADLTRLSKEKGAGPFGPAERPMGGYLSLPAAWRSAPEQGSEWVGRAFEHVSSLPPKQPKPKKSKG